MPTKRINKNMVFAVLMVSAMINNAYAQASSALSVPPGTDVVVKTVDLMSSKLAKTGDKFVVEVAEDVVVNQQVVIPAGTRGSGTVIFARAKRAGGVPGALDVRIDYIETLSGKIKLKARDTNRGNDRRNAGTAAQLAFGLIGFFAVQGSEIELQVGTKIGTVVATPRPIAIPVEANSTAAAGLEVPASAAAVVTPIPTTTDSATVAPVNVPSSPNSVPVSNTTAEEPKKDH